MFKQQSLRRGLMKMDFFFALNVRQMLIGLITPSCDKCGCWVQITNTCQFRERNTFSGCMIHLARLRKKTWQNWAHFGRWNRIKHWSTPSGLVFYLYPQTIIPLNNQTLIWTVNQFSKFLYLAFLSFLMVAWVNNLNQMILWCIKLEA